SRNVNIDFQFSGRNLGNRNFRNGAQNERDYPSIRQERLSVVPSDAPPPSLPSRIVPSAQAQQRQIVPSRLLTNTQDFPTLTPSAPPSSSTSTLPNWRQEVQNMRHQPAPSRAPIQISSGEQFPTLVSARGGTSVMAPTAAAQGVKNKTKNPAANTVWGNGKPIQLFTSNNTPPPKVKEPETPRRQFIPLPDIWPEGMRERVEAKMKGLPDPGPQEPEIVDPLFRVEAAKKEKRKAAKKKSKTVPISAYANREQPDDFAQPSKFDALAEEAAPTLRSVADSIGENKKPSEQFTSKENGTVASTSPKSSSNEVSDFPSLGSSSSAGSGFPSLTDIASGLTSIWKGRPNQSSNPPPPPSTSSSSKQTTAWSTGPPPGFS
uniref:Uncharacterized protein n=1 Tax=Panagrolaimus sp. ES5 TaxID=591445 RepID=A0AC34F501_9BILA